MDRSGVGEDLARVGEVKITQMQFDEALRVRQDELRQQMGEQYDAKMLQTPTARREVLDTLIDRQLIAMEASRLKLFVPDQAVRALISQVEAFQEDGQFSNDRYQTLLAGRGMSPAMFEAQVRQDLILQQLIGTLGQSAFVAKTINDHIVRLQTDKREISLYKLPIARYESEVKISEEQAKAYFDSHQNDFMQPERAKIDYVVLSEQDMAQKTKVKEEDVRAWYDSHQKDYQRPEERRASHILLTFDAAAKEKDKNKEALKQRAESLLATIKADPARFAELAKKESADPGSAKQGGDLGFFARGMMVKPFEEAVFALKEKEISAVVESEFGFHIIQLNAIRPATVRPFDEVKADITAELARNAAARQFAEAAEQFTNTVYDQSDSLAPAAEQFKLTVQHSDWMTHSVNSAYPALTANVLEKVFAADSVVDKRNTEAVDIGKNNLVAARISEYQPKKQQDFAEVRDRIVQQLSREAATRLAEAEGQKLLAALQADQPAKQADGKAIQWEEKRQISRLDLAMEPRTLPAAIAKTVFALPTQKLPVYAATLDAGNAYVLTRLSAVTADAKLGEALQKNLGAQLKRLYGEGQLQDYLSALRHRYAVEINDKVLTPAEK